MKLNNLPIKLILAALTLTTGQLSFAQQMVPEFTLEASEDCGNYRAYSPLSGPNASSLVVEFSDFAVTTATSNFTSRECYMQAMVKVPAGMRFRVIQAVADGEYFISEQGSAKVDLFYQSHINGRDFPCEKSETFTRASGRNPNNFIVRACGNPIAFQYSECQSWDQQIPIEGYFRLTASRGANDNFDTDLALYNSETILASATPQQARAVWKWEWLDCHQENPWLGKEFRSRYQNPLGRWIQGYTEIYGETGRYVTDSGQEGSLYQISYSNAYQTVQGLWRFQDGSGGWFSFHLSPDGLTFEGQWGEGQNSLLPPKGRWIGEYYPW